MGATVDTALWLGLLHKGLDMAQAVVGPALVQGPCEAPKGANVPPKKPDEPASCTTEISMTGGVSACVFHETPSPREPHKGARHSR